MTAQPFTRNYSDHSNNSGFQFEFFCDKCGSGHRSTYQTSTMGVAAGLLRAAGNFFGGSVASAGYSAEHLKDMLRGPAWDSAFKEAIDEIRPKFHQCTRCGKWVCPDVCWNEARELCEECAPNLQEHAVAAQAQVAVEQVWEKARKTDQTGGLDTASELNAGGCVKCQATLKANAKFCSSCGTPVAKKAFCAECGAAVDATAKFCGECGKPR